MNAVEVARNHFDSWNCHDADAIAGAFVEGDNIRSERTYHDRQTVDEQLVSFL